MHTVGIRELRARTSEILRRVRDGGQPVDITSRGEVIARIIPVAPPADDIAHDLAVIDSIEQLAAEIGSHYPQAANVDDLMKDLRG